MKWKIYVIIAGCLTLSSLAPSIGWGQSQHRVAPVDGTASVEGSVQDAATKRPIPGATVTAKTQEGVIRAQQLTGPDGSYQVRLDPKQTYLLTIQANGFDIHDEQLTFTSPKVERLRKLPTLLYRPGTRPGSPSINQPTTIATSASAPLSAPIGVLQPTSGSAAVVSNARVTPPKTLDAKVIYTPPLVVAPVGKTTQLRAIQFVQSKAELLPDAMPALEQLLAFMQSKPTAEIELSGHTDNQGDFDENLRLSKQRVDVVKAYLVQNGIDANRITTRGFGPTRPIASNKSETTRQQNRRVEMIVVKQ